MQRFIQEKLLQWKKSSTRKSLILRGARQVGKTYAVRQFGKTYKNFIEINFEISPELKVLFESNLDPEVIVQKLSLILEKPIIPGETLLFIDEIQECPRAIIALRYFYEKMHKLHVVSAGSLLNFAIQKVGVPVGRVSFLNMYPLSFMEFLLATGNKMAYDEILNHDINEQLTDVIHEKFLEYLSIYMAIGGMPEVVQSWLDEKDVSRCLTIQQQIIRAYQQDFQKYAKSHQIKYVDTIFKFIPLQLGQKFQYHHIPGGYRKRELEPCLDLLEKADIIHKVYHTDANGLPLGAEVGVQKNKIIFLDVGLAQALMGLQARDWILTVRETLINRGAIAESFVGQELLAYSNNILDNIFYWAKESKNSQAEVDYILQKDRDIIPVEVKSGKGTTLKSMHMFLQSHPDSPYGIRLSTNNYSICDNIHSYPLYSVIRIA